MKLVDYKHTKKISFFLFFLSLLLPLSSQTWDWHRQLGGIKNEDGQSLVVDQSGQAIIGGFFEDQLTLESQMIVSTGERDVFLASFKPEGGLNWLIQGGGQQDDDLAKVAVDQDNHPIITGSYWIEANFGDIQISSAANPKSLFLIKYSSEGLPLWGKSLDGGPLKEVTDLQTDAGGNIYLTGYFQEELIIEDTTLVATGDTDLFICKFSGDGELIWAGREGFKGDTRGMCLAVTGSREVVVAGIFNDTTRIGAHIFTANTFDRDVFICQFDEQGVVKWARKAGGVHDDEVTGIALDHGEHIYVTGYLVGVMTLSEDLFIQSSNGNPDFYLLKYSPEGIPLDARAMGGDLAQQTTAIAINGSQIAVSGFYLGDFSVDGLDLAGTSLFQGFLIGFNEELEARWLYRIGGNGTIFSNGVSYSPEGKIYTVGSFSPQIQFDNASVVAAGQYDAFLAGLNAALTPSGAPEIGDDTLFRVFPNPVSHTIFIETELLAYHLTLINSGGRLIYQSQNEKQLDISGLPNGIYTLLIDTRKRRFHQQILIQR